MVGEFCAQTELTQELGQRVHPCSSGLSQHGQLCEARVLVGQRWLPSCHVFGGQKQPQASSLMDTCPVESGPTFS